MIMKKNTKTRVLAACAAPWLILASAAPALAAGLSVDLRAGGEYDSNIVVSERDLNTGAGDFSAELDLSVDYEIKFNRKGAVEVGYNFRQSLHQDLTDFDVQTHGFKASVKQRFGAFKLGVSYRYFDSSLGGSGFLTLQRISPYVTFYAGKTFLLRATYSYEDKNLKTSIARDATSNIIGADAYVLIDRSRTYVSFGYKMKILDAVGPAFDYDANIVRAQFTTRVPLLGKTSKFRVGVNYEKRDYDNITPSIGEVRDDKRLTLKTSLRIPLGDSLYALASLRYRDNKSNFLSADYSETVSGLQFGFSF